VEGDGGKGKKKKEPKKNAWQRGEPTENPNQRLGGHILGGVGCQISDATKKKGKEEREGGKCPENTGTQRRVWRNASFGGWIFHPAEEKNGGSISFSLRELAKRGEKARPKGGRNSIVDTISGKKKERKRRLS